MSKQTFSQLSPLFFLQTFIMELMQATEAEGEHYCQSLIEHIARGAGQFFEQSYREQYGLTETLSQQQYIDLILALKNRIGGGFSLDSVQPETITVVNDCCPFGEQVSLFPELCRMTSSVFGGIAARNFGYAKVEIKRSIARGHGGCEVCIHLDADAAQCQPGLEYRNTPTTEARALNDRIEQRMRSIWWRGPKQALKAKPAIIARSPAMQTILRQVEVVAPTPATVLVEGPTGVGKELIARALHALSERSQRPFIAINCGAIPETLIESALFGHEKGAFTGATEIRRGFFERAEGGTLFLDEVDALSPAAQTGLLRALQEGEIERVGGKHTLQVNVRIIAACNQSLEQQVEQQSFRQDLFYRLNVVRLGIPALAERPEDLPDLVDLILKRLNEKYRKQIRTVSPEVMNQIQCYPWPGNVRELENILERSVLFCRSQVLDQLELPGSGQGKADDWQASRKRALDEHEKNFLQNALNRHQGDVKQIAAAMKLTPRAVYAKLAKHGLSRLDWAKTR
ncbi:MAG: sigma 54-interacting transcriptional regulator [Methylococcales bacterium]|nr:sigma 54-interacting transcriptional regulator [Methylococcales bacterium]